MDRLSTGIDGLDELMEGGIPKGRTILIKGIPGAGKTIMGLMFLLQGAYDNQKGAYLTLEQNSQEIISENSRLMPNLKEYIGDGTIYFFDRSIHRDIIHKPDVKSLFSEKNIAGSKRKNEIKDPKQFDKFINSMFRQLEKGGYTRLIIDSLNALKRKNRLMLKSLNKQYDSEDHYELLLNILQRAKELDITTYLLAEQQQINTNEEAYESFLADGVIELDINDAVHTRFLKVKKLRGTDHTLKPCSFKILPSKGIEINRMGFR